MTIRVSPLRKLVPPLVVPAGLLLLLGYCFVEKRSSRAGAAEREARVRAEVAAVKAGSPTSSRVVVVSEGAKSVSLTAPMRALRLDLPIAIVVVLGVVLWVRVLRRDRDDPGTPGGPSGGATP